MLTQILNLKSSASISRSENAGRTHPRPAGRRGCRFWLIPVLCLLSSVLWGQQTTVIYDVATNQLKRPTADQFATANSLATTAQLAGKQPLNTNLTAISGLGTAADKLTYWTGSGTAALTDFTALARANAGLTSLTAGGLLLGNGSSAITASDLSYTSPTLSVPAGFSLSGAGALSFLAGGTNQSIAIAPSGTGGLLLGTASSTTNQIRFQSGSAIIDSNGTTLSLKRGAGTANASMELYDSTNTAQARLDVTTSPSFRVTSGGGTTVWADISSAGIKVGNTTPGVISNSSGSIILTGGGTNQGVRLVPSGTGSIGIGAGLGTNSASLIDVIQPGSSTPVSAWYGSTAVFQALAETTAGAADFGLGFASGAVGANKPSIGFRKSRGTLASPTVVSVNDIIGGITGGAYDGSSFINSAQLNFSADGQLTIGPGVVGQRIGFFMGLTGTSSRTETVAVRSNGSLQPGFSNKTIAAWGGNGAHFAVLGNTITFDSATGTSSTVAIAAVSSFLQATLGAVNSSVTVTDAPTVYIQNAPTSGGNPTITRAHALAINAGRLTLGLNNGSSSTSSADGIWFGTDVTLYRSAASIATLSGKLVTTASSTTRAGMNLPHGSAPSSPTDGDLWTTTAGLYVRINGTTVGPLN